MADRTTNLKPSNSAIGVPLSIGPVRLATNLLLAPVAGYCDLAFRIVCREQGGVGLACTDLLSPHGLLRGTARSLDLAQTSEEDRPLCMQIYGNDADILADGARWAVDHGADVIDINMGCPVDKVVKKNGGSMLLCDPNRTVGMTEGVVRAVESASGGRVPVTAKMRLGWANGDLVAPSLAVALARIGIALVTIHGRTTAQRFTGQASLDGIRAVVEAVGSSDCPIPVIGNGDVTEPEHAIRMMQVTGCRGVMVGRGSFSRPWLFRQAWALQNMLANAPKQPPLPLGEGGESASRERDTGTLRAHIAAPRADPMPLEEGGRGFAATGRGTHHASAPALLGDPSESARIAIIRRYLDLMVRFRGEHYAMNHIRRRISWLAKTLGPCKPFKEAVRVALDPASVHAVLDEFLTGGLRSRLPGPSVAGGDSIDPMMHSGATSDVECAAA